MINYTNNIVYSTLNVNCYSAVCWLVDKSGAVIITLYTACQSTVHPSPDMKSAVMTSKPFMSNDQLKICPMDQFIARLFCIVEHVLK